jgi:AraC-like DNA-binding protein
MGMQVHWATTVPGLEMQVANDLPTFQTDRHFHAQHHQFVFVEKGIRTFQCEGQAIVISPGQIALLPAGLVHAGGQPVSGCSFRNLYIPSSLFPAGLLYGSGPIRLEPSNHFSRLQSLLMEVPLRSRDAPTELFSLLRALCDGPQHGRGVVRSSDPSVLRARNYLSERSDTGVSLDRLARFTGMSKYELLRRFHQNVGLPPHAYQIQNRIEIAKRFLKLGHNQKWIAAELRFSDQSHFARHFKRLTGISPGVYQKGS